MDPVAGGGAAAILVAVRLGIALRLVPLLGGRPLPWPAWLALVAALVPLAGSWVAPPPADDLGSWPAFAALLLGEAAVGAALGLLLRLALAVFELAGGMADAAVGGPGGSEDGEARGGPHGVLFTMWGVAAFLGMGGHRVLLAALRGSFAALPPGGIPAAAGGLEPGVVGLLAGGFAVALAVAGPLFVAGLAADLTAALWARIDPAGGPGSGAPALRTLAIHGTLVLFLAAGVALAADAASEGVARVARELSQNTS